ncbi:hypothetical protein QBC41DRAFT_157709 [Cercophora samala]|uniref:Secreted protein n=1 Tax=Cercophora samala TaxID=330535 RepID=A0AA40D7E9_9PEZI|nr:hypothetical protein QBC41DRAFT_157709 [Cercophora samala]
MYRPYPKQSSLLLDTYLFMLSCQAWACLAVCRVRCEQFLVIRNRMSINRVGVTAYMCHVMWKCPGVDKKSHAAPSPNQLTSPP